MKLLIFFFVISSTYSSLALEAVPGEYIVRYRNGSPSIQALGKTSLQHNMRLRNSWTGMNLHHFKVRAEDDEPAETLRNLREDPDVLFAEPNYYVQASNLPFFMTGAPIRAPESWSQGVANGPSVITPVVAVLDSGLDINHSVFDGTGRLWENSAELNGTPGVDDDGNGFIDDVHGWNFINNNTDLTDNSGHGTHVSGIVVGATEDISNMSGSEKVQVMPLKFLDADGVGTTSAAISAIYYAVDNGAKILNNSWGGSDYSVSLHEAITYSFNQGTLFVAAAGNNSNNNDNSATFPASYDVPNVLSVGASSDSDGLASFSNFGAQSVDLLSPGVNIISTIPGGGFGVSSGTSMSTPFVAGLAALAAREAPHFSGFQLKENILNSVDSVSSASGVTLTGGRVAFEATVLATQANSSDATFLPEYTPVYNYSSRELASTDAGSGCGRVREVYKDHLYNGRKPGRSLISSFLVSLFLFLPLFIIVFGKFLHRNRVRRKYKRIKVDFMGDLCLSGMNIRVKVKDFSPGGAGVMLTQDEGYVRGLNAGEQFTKAILKIYRGESKVASYPCTIVRNIKGQVGLKF